MNSHDCSTSDTGLRPCRRNDGSFSLWSEHFGQAFHSARGAIQEAKETFLTPAGLERFAAGSTLNKLSALGEHNLAEAESQTGSLPGFADPSHPTPRASIRRADGRPT